MINAIKSFGSIAMMMLTLIYVHTGNSIADDWPMRGGTPGRCSWSHESDGPAHWTIGPKWKDANSRDSKNVLWHADGFYEGKGSPVVSQGLVWIGTSNTQGVRGMDAGVLTCFRANDGQKVYERVSAKLGQPGSGYQVAHRDWPGTGITSSPLIEGNRLWYCTNRLEIVCLDIDALVSQTGMPSELWSVDLSKLFGVMPRDVHLGSPASRCSLVGYKDWLYTTTTHSRNSEGAFDSTLPSLVCLNKTTGQMHWKDSSPGEGLFQEPHANPTIVELKDRALVAIGQGDGWLRAFDCDTGKPVWQFNMNDRSSQRPLKKHTSLRVVESPAFDGERLYVVAGEQYEASMILGRIVALDPRRNGNISTMRIDESGIAVPNPNNGCSWELNGTLEIPFEVCVGGVAVDDQFVFAGTLQGEVFCFDKRTGEICWKHDMKASLLTTPLIVGDKVYVADEAGDVEILRASRFYEKIFQQNHQDCFEASPVYSNGTLFLQSRSGLWAIRKDASK